MALKIKLRTDSPFYLILFPLFFVFHGYVEHYPLISITIVVKLFLSYLIAFISTTVCFYFIYRKWYKAALSTLTLMLVYFFFGAFHDFLKSIFPGTLLVKYTYLIPLVTISIIIIIIFIGNSKSKFRKAGQYTNLLSIALIIIDAILLLTLPPRQSTPLFSKNYNTCDTCSKPDIYLIIADEYAGDKQLREMFGFDNSGFNTELKKRGFHTIRNPISNYNYTPYSVASLLNMNYLTGITEKANDQKNRNKSFTLINKNSIVDILRQHEYSFINHSLFDFADIPASIDNMFFKTREKLITTHTLIGRLERDIAFNLITRFKFQFAIDYLIKNQINNNEYLINQTKKVPVRQTKTIHPKFIYTHLSLPHYPYFFDQYGNQYSSEFIMSEHQSRKDYYIEYLLYSNKRLLDLLDHIQKSTKNQAVIFLLSDHGFRYYGNRQDPTYVYNTINHIYLPDMDYADFKDGQSHVNHFRTFFNKQFHLNLPMLKDTTFFMKEY